MAQGSTERITVALVEDDERARARLTESIRANPALRLAGEYPTGAEALAALEKSAPDVLLVDIGLPDISGLEIVRRVSQRHRQCDILVVTILGDQQTVLAALEAGARGYLLKGEMAHDISVDIQDLRGGGSPLSPVIARQVLKRLELRRPSGSNGNNVETRLTVREAELLNLIARGFSYAESAQILGIAVLTVQTHLKHIYRKLAVHSKTEAVYEADKRGLL